MPPSPAHYHYTKAVTAPLQAVHVINSYDAPKAHDNPKARHASKQKCVANMPKLHKVRPVGLEPTTHGLRVRCYYQLS